jgi:hypothetical protein
VRLSKKVCIGVRRSTIVNWPGRQHRQFARWVESLLQIDVERTGTEAATVHRAQHLNVADRIEAVAGRNALADNLQDFGGAILGISA